MNTPYTTSMRTAVSQCSEALARRKWTIAFAESASAGRLAYEFALAPRSGETLIGGIVCYNACVKKDILEVDPKLIATHTAESAEVTQALAEAYGRSVPADVCVALTGLTAPGGSETPQKPVGTVFIHVKFPHTSVAERLLFAGGPEDIVEQAVMAVASLILRQLTA